MHRSSLFRQSCICLVAMLAVALLTTTNAMGQRSRRAPKPKTKRGKGKVIGIQSGLLQIQMDNNGEVWVISPAAESLVQFTSTAKKDWIRKGMIARVTGTFDRKGNGQEPIGLVQVFTPRPDYPLGAVLQEEKPDRDKPQIYLVAGVVKRISEGKYTIDAGKKQYTFELADETEVEVDLLNDLDWVQVGDKLQVNLKYLNLGEGVIATAEITGTKPLAGEKEKPNTRRRRSKRRKKVAAAEPADTASEIRPKQPKPKPKRQLQRRRTRQRRSESAS